MLNFGTAIRMKTETPSKFPMPQKTTKSLAQQILGKLPLISDFAEEICSVIRMYLNFNDFSAAN
jgi:hypothetical protein